MSNEVAKEGHIFVCLACSKRSRDKYGDQPIDHGWDVSCVMRAEEFAEDRLVIGEHGRVSEIKSDDITRT